MIRSTYTIITEETNPYKNIALEALILESLPPETAVLYLWQNRRTVVIGRNQNAWKECRVDALEADGGFTARRLSGGGAVFHDMGNLNFTFLSPKDGYDVEKQCAVILRAVRKAGISAQKTGRNDIEADGRKFSGNAFYQAGENAYHHGTLLVDADLDAVSRYLSAPADKIKAKGVDSVRKRVVNLTEFAPDLTIPRLRELLIEAFDDVYGLKSAPLIAPITPPSAPPPDAENPAGFTLSTPEHRRRLAALEHKFADSAWVFGKNPPFQFQAAGRFPWGGVELCFSVERNRITDAAVFSDAMDEAFILGAAPALTGADFTRRAALAALTPLAEDAPPEQRALRRTYCEDIAGLLAQPALRASIDDMRKRN
jgi:lipoate-protein ligase A